MRITIVPYKIGSQSAKGLADGLSAALNKRVFRVRSDSQTFRPQNKLVVNWGNSQPLGFVPSRILNPPEKVRVAGNKLLTFMALSPNSLINIPMWTADEDEAAEWIEDGETVVARTVLDGHSGRGIFLLDSTTDFVEAPLYTKYKKKKSEFRVHVFNGEVIDIQEKRRERDNDGINHKIRNRDNGWVFCRENIVEPNGLREQALLAISTLGLDFGAVDIIYNSREDTCYVLEVNTAPGLEGTTLEKYIDAILNLEE